MNKLILSFFAIICLTACQPTNADFFLASISVNNGYAQFTEKNTPIVLYHSKLGIVKIDFNEPVNKKILDQNISMLKRCGYTSTMNAPEIFTNYKYSLDKSRKTLTIELPTEVSEKDKAPYSFEYELSIKEVLHGSGLLLLRAYNEYNAEYFKSINRSDEGYKYAFKNLDTDSNLIFKLNFSQTIDSSNLQEVFSFGDQHCASMNQAKKLKAVANGKSLILTIPQGCLDASQHGYIRINHLKSTTGKRLDSLFIGCFAMDASDYFTRKRNNQIYPEIEDAMASSTLVSTISEQYMVQNLFDNSYKSWGEGVDGSGIGESFEYHLKQEVEIKEISLRNGCGELRNYFNNNRVKRLTIADEHGNKTEIQLKDTYLNTNYKLPHKIKGKIIAFTIVEVYKGLKWDYTFLSELTILPIKMHTNTPFKQTDELRDFFVPSYLRGSQEEEPDFIASDYSNYSYTVSSYPRGDAEAKESHSFYLLKDGTFLSVNINQDASSPITFNCSPNTEVDTAFINIIKHEGLVPFCYEKREEEKIYVDYFTEDDAAQMYTNGVKMPLKKSVFYWNGDRFEQSNE